jgi:hypothetical protein
MTALSATTISGYVDTSAVWNPGTGNANPAPYLNNAGKQDGFNLDSIDIKISKPVDETGWSAGYTSEIMLGPDGVNIDGGAYPIRQAFVGLHMPVGNGIDWEVGRWDAILGYESNDSYNNPNFTRSYAKSFEPSEDTGVLGSYNITSEVNLQLGVANTVGNFGLNTRSIPGGEYVESKKSLVSLLTLTAPDSWGSFKGSAFYAGFDLGEGGANHDTAGVTVSPHNRSQIYLGTTIKTPVSGLSFGGTWDAIFHNNVGDVDTSYFQAFNGYLSYKATDKLTFNGRIEYAEGESLGALADAVNGVPFTAGGLPVHNPLKEVVAATGTVQYELWDNVLSRLEIRWDHSAKGGDAFGGNGVAGSGTIPDKKNEVLLAANVIYKF